MSIDYEVGNFIAYVTDGGTRRVVRVEARFAADEPGWDHHWPGFDGTLVYEGAREFVPARNHDACERFRRQRGTPVSVWGFDDQIECVIDPGCPSGRCWYRADLHSDGECPPPECIEPDDGPMTAVY